MCEWLDQTVGDLMSYLKKNHWTKTPWLFTLQTMDGYNQINVIDTLPVPRAPHEGGVRTPIMFKLPGVIEPEINPQHW